MKRLKVLALLLGLSLSLITVPAQAQGVWGACEEDASSSTICADAKDGSDASDIVMNLIDIFLFVIGMLSVIMIIHSGLKYVNSRGDAEQIKSAKNTLLYSVVGLIVAMLAFVIVNFVIDIFLNADTTATAVRHNSVEREVTI